LAANWVKDICGRDPSPGTRSRNCSQVTIPRLDSPKAAHEAVVHGESAEIAEHKIDTRSLEERSYDHTCD
jgi:hypothetical protein